MRTMSLLPGRAVPPEPIYNQNNFKDDFKVSTEAELVDEVFVFLGREAQRQEMEITFHVDNVRYSEGGLILLPITWKTSLTTREETEKMLLLEDAWNEQDPPPVRSVRLADAGNPELSIRSTPPPLNQAVKQTV